MYQAILDYVSRHITLTEKEQQQFLGYITERRILKKQYFLQAGDVCAYQSMVAGGCLRVFFADPAGTEHTMQFAIENWWVADLGSFITGKPALYHIQALEDSVLLQLHRDDMEGMYAAIPKLERFFRIIVQNGYIAAQNRIISNLSEPAEVRYNRFRDTYPQIDNRVPQYMIASYLGITPEFLSKIRKRR